MLVVRICEGIGNQMFEYAYAYALAQRMKKKDIKVYLDIRDNDVTLYDRKRIVRAIDIDKFNISIPIADNEVLRHWNYIMDKTIGHRMIYYLQSVGLWKYQIILENKFNYEKKYLQIKDYTYINGWFQHYQYFSRYRKQLLSEFTLKEDWHIPERLKQIMNEYQVVSMHVRRGDYITNSYARKVLPVCRRDYYMNAAEYIKTRVSNPYLFIFTNDEKWVKDNLYFDIPSIMITNYYDLSDVQEMILMSQCKHNIIANSTYSWWGAWLNTYENKIVISPYRWFKDESRENIALENWVRM